MILTKEHQSLAVLVGLGALGVYFVTRMAARQAVKAADSAANAVSPFNQDNIFNSAFERTGAIISGNPHWSLGGQVYDWLHGDEIEAVTNGTQ